MGQVGTNGSSKTRKKEQGELQTSASRPSWRPNQSQEFIRAAKIRVTEIIEQSDAGLILIPSLIHICVKYIDSWDNLNWVWFMTTSISTDETLGSHTFAFDPTTSDWREVTFPRAPFVGYDNEYPPAPFIGYDDTHVVSPDGSTAVYMINVGGKMKMMHYSLVTNKWLQLPDSDPPFPNVRSAAAVSCDHMIYFAGGRNMRTGNLHHGCFSYDPLNGHCMTLPSQPYSAKHLWIVKGQLCTMDESHTTVTKTKLTKSRLALLNLSKLSKNKKIKWRLGPSMNAVRWDYQSVHVPGLGIIVAGGQSGYHFLDGKVVHTLRNDLELLPESAIGDHENKEGWTWINMKCTLPVAMSRFHMAWIDHGLFVCTSDGKCWWRSCPRHLSDDVDDQDAWIQLPDTPYADITTASVLSHTSQTSSLTLSHDGTECVVADRGP